MSIVDKRGQSYGGKADGYENLQRIARLWSGYLGAQVTAHDVTWMMTLLKASRSRQDPGHADNYIDAQGYVDLARSLSEFAERATHGHAVDIKSPSDLGL